MVAVSEPFGHTKDGQEVQKVILRSSTGFEAHILTLGAALQRLLCPSRNSCDPPTDVVLGYDTVQDYEQCPYYIGVVIGRQAGRVRRGQFQLDGRQVSVSKNHGEHSLHGGFRGLSRQVWAIDSMGDSCVTLRLASRDGEDGYPGNLAVSVTYTVASDNSLRLEYLATCDQPCPVSLTSHAYFNLSGHSVGDVANHRVKVGASRMLELDSDSLPTGRLLPVQDTPADLRAGCCLADNLQFDHIFVLDDDSGRLELKQPAAVAEERSCGRRLSCFTDQPVLVLYTGAYLSGWPPGKESCRYAQHAGLCLEAQLYPDACNCPQFPSALLQPGRQYRQTTVYQLSYAR